MSVEASSVLESCRARLRASLPTADSQQGFRAIAQSNLVALIVVVSLVVASAAILAPTWEALALCLAVSCSLGLWMRVTQLKAAAGPKLSFFVGDSGVLRLNEDLSCSKAVYCIGVRNDGLTTVRDVHVNVDLMQGDSAPMLPARLRVFGGDEAGVVLHPNETEYFCVVKIVQSREEHSGSVMLCCYRDVIGGSFHLLELLAGRVLTVSVAGENAPKISRQLRIVSKYDQSNWSLAMTLFPAGTAVPVVSPSQQMPLKPWGQPVDCSTQHIGDYGSFDAVRP